MRITFFSNYFNAHQLPLAFELNMAEGVDFNFVSLLANGGAVGRSNLDGDYPFVIREYQDKSSAALAMRHALEDDVVIFGDMAGKEQYVRARAKADKPFFRYAERLLKRGDWWRFMPPKIYRTWDRFTRYEKSNMFVLCSSAYTARDLSMFGFPLEKCIKWGYFPQVQPGERNINSRNSLLLCSAQRLIPWKRVDLQIHVFSHVLSAGVDAKLIIAGDGPERRRLEALASELGVARNVEFLGELSHNETLVLMRECSVFLATSDRNEGWGATVNEAMSMGCCVVASEEMGSVPYLIKDERNGFSFKGGDIEAAFEKIMRGLSEPELARRLGDEAEKTVMGAWSAKEAAARFVELARHVSAGGSPGLSDFQLWADGPLSAAWECDNA